MAFWDTLKKIGKGVVSVAKATVKTVANVATGFASGGIAGAVSGAVKSVSEFKTAGEEIKNIVSGGKSVVTSVKSQVPTSSVSVPISTNISSISVGSSKKYEPKVYRVSKNGGNDSFDSVAYNLQTAILRG